MRLRQQLEKESGIFVKLTCADEALEEIIWWRRQAPTIATYCLRCTRRFLQRLGVGKRRCRLRD